VSEAVGNQPRSSAFWALLTVIGLFTPILCAAVFLGLCLLIATIGFIVSSGSAILQSDVTIAIIFVCAKFAIPLSPLTALAVPYCFHRSSISRWGKGKPDQGTFILWSIAFGALGPFVLDYAIFTPISGLGKDFGLKGLAPIYAIVGSVVAPLSALILWPWLLKLDANQSMIRTGVI
jgi:hypothetical protein